MNRPYARIFFSLFVTAAVLVLFLPRTAKFGYDYKKGNEWTHETLYAQFDFPVFKTEQEIIDELGESSSTVIPYYRLSDEIVNKNMRTVEGLSLGAHKSMVVSAMKKIYDKGIVSDDGVKQSSRSDRSEVLYIQKNKRAAKCPVTEVYKVSDARAKLLADVTAKDPGSNFDSLFRAENLYDLLVPNLIYDRQTTELVNAEAKAQVSPTSGYVSAGQLIVSEGELVTAEIAQMLDSYKKEYEANLGYSGSKFLFWLGNIILSMMMVALLFFAILFTSPGLFRDNRFYYILMIFLLASISAMIVVRIREELLYMVPFTLFALLLQAFVKPKVIVPVYLVSLMPLLIFTHNGLLLFVMFSVAGVAAIYAFHFFARGWKQVVVVGITFLVLSLTYAGFHMNDMATASILRINMFLAVASILAWLGYPVVYLFEKLFNLVSNSRLAELSDTANPVIRQLEQKAPGTFQHSLQVMNMADTMARAIGANPVLVRAGALYHDIGKMENPMCFVENESLHPSASGGKYHSALTPEQSAADIIGHVSSGVELAKKRNIPDLVVDFIRTHHGTSKVMYFYNKYLNEGGDPDNVAAFTYPGRKPETKEQIILMICDSVEAGSRTLPDYSPEVCSDFVEAIVKGKSDEGQFDNADISIRELGILKEELKAYLGQIHHERISYDNKNKTK